MSGKRLFYCSAPLRSAPSRSCWLATTHKHAQRRGLRTSRPLLVVKPYLLADIGEGIREVQIIQWFVKPGARVEQFQALCEVQSDKATVEITSRFDGIVKKLHYEADDMAQVGKALCDIDIQSEITEADAAVTEEAPSQSSPPPSESIPEAQQEEHAPPLPASTQAQVNESTDIDSGQSAKRERHKSIATPAVRHMCMDMDVNIADVQGTGKDGRVLKEDVQHFISNRSATAPQPNGQTPPAQQAEEQIVPLSPIQAQMYKAMTRSLSIPHFLYTDTIDMTNMKRLRTSLKARGQTISTLAFILKAASLALTRYPLLNARVHAPDSTRPALALRAAHNFGIAVDTPGGLVVPVVRDVQTRSVLELNAEIARLASAARDGSLGVADFRGGTFTVSNVGSIGGGVVGPVLVEGQVAILGIGRERVVPGFGEDGVTVVRRSETVFSWSADHRVVDGATAARCADEVKRFLEAPEEMVLELR